jgi:FMN-dependent NADH-azoreductase
MGKRLTVLHKCSKFAHVVDYYLSSTPMAKILHIDASPRVARSHSRQLAREFITAWQAAKPNDPVTYRDLTQNPVPHVTEAWVAAGFTAPAEYTPEMAAAMAISDELVDEFLAADRYVFSMPMYNLNIPSVFKAYIDQIIRAGKTFAVTEQGYAGLVHNRKMLVLTSRGADYRPGAAFAPYDFQEPYLRAIFGFIGVVDMQFINADGMDMGDDMRQQSLTTAKAAVAAAVEGW